MNRVKKNEIIKLKWFNHNLIVVDSVIVYIKNCKHFFYYTASFIKYLYMQIRHYLIKYALFAYISKIWTLDKARFKSIYLFV